MTSQGLVSKSFDEMNDKGIEIKVGGESKGEEISHWIVLALPKAG